MFEGRKNFTKRKIGTIIVLDKENVVQNPPCGFFMSCYSSVEIPPKLMYKRAAFLMKYEKRECLYERGFLERYQCV